MKRLEKEGKENKKVVHSEFDTDDDMEMQLKNTNDGKAEGKFE